MAPLLRYCLPAIGVCRNFPRALVFSTLDYMGLHIQHLHSLQEIARLKDIIPHTFNDTLTGKLYQMSMELFFIELGLPNQLSRYAIEVLDGLTTNSLVKSTMLFLRQYNIVLKHSIEVKQLRENDSSIMEQLLNLGIPLPDLVVCNRCRLFLKVCMISEISSGDGTLLLDEAWLMSSEHKLKSWPSYPKPSTAMWNT
jgi:hypothetical protein